MKRLSREFKRRILCPIWGELYYYPLFQEKKTKENNFVLKKKCVRLEIKDQKTPQKMEQLYYSQVAKQGKSPWFMEFAATHLGFDKEKVRKYTFQKLLSELLQRHFILPDLPPPSPSLSSSVESVVITPLVQQQVETSPPKKKKNRKSKIHFDAQQQQQQQEQQLPVAEPPIKTPQTTIAATTPPTNHTQSLLSILQDWHESEIVSRQLWYENQANSFLRKLQTQKFMEEQLKKDTLYTDDFDLQAITIDFKCQKSEFKFLVRELHEEIEKREHQKEPPIHEWMQQETISSELFHYFCEKRKLQKNFLEELKKIRDSLLQWNV